MKNKTGEVVDNIHTYTDTGNRKPMEVLLIGADTDRLGKQNTLKPHSFNREHITSWIRRRYFFLGGVVYAQIPRKIQDFPDAAREKFNANASFASDVMVEEKEIRVYYSKNETCLFVSNGIRVSTSGQCLK